jgi:hypothetical protein
MQFRLSRPTSIARPISISYACRFQSKFEAVEHKSGWGWYVRAILPDGQRAHIVGFRTEAEANEWIKAEAPAWLAEHLKQK